MTVKEFADLMVDQRIPFLWKRGYWKLGQVMTVHIVNRPGNFVFRNRPY